MKITFLGSSPSVNIGPQLIKSGAVSELIKQIRATIVKKAAVIDQSTTNIPPGTIDPRPTRRGGGGTPPKQVLVQDMIQKIKDNFEISDEEALFIREVSQERIEDKAIKQTVAAHLNDIQFLDSIFKNQVNGQIQDAYTLRERYEPLCDPKYTGAGSTFDIMSHTVIQKSMSLTGAA